MFRVLELGRVGNNLSKNYMSGVLLRVSFFDLENWKARDPTPEGPKAIANNEENSVDLITGYDARADSNSPGTEIRTKPKILGGR